MPAQPPIRMGREAVPLWIIDDAHPAPHTLHAAAAAASLAASTADLYPGVRAPAPAAWTDWLTDAVQAWPGLEQARVLRADFAIATRDPAKRRGVRPPVLERGVAPGTWDRYLVFPSSHPLVENDTIKLW